MWGRGTIDIKFSVAALLEAASVLLAGGYTQPTRTLMFAFGHDEEVSGGGGRRARATLSGMGEWGEWSSGQMPCWGWQLQLSTAHVTQTGDSGQPLACCLNGSPASSRQAITQHNTL